MYPGISTNLTLAKYYILIPMIFRSALSEVKDKLENGEQVNRQQVVEDIREKQGETTDILAEYKKIRKEPQTKFAVLLVENGHR